MPQCVPLRMWQHQLGVGCTWVIMRVAKPDCSAQLTHPVAWAGICYWSWAPCLRDCTCHSWEHTHSNQVVLFSGSVWKMFGCCQMLPPLPGTQLLTKRYRSTCLQTHFFSSYMLQKRMFFYHYECLFATFSQLEDLRKAYEVPVKKKHWLRTDLFGWKYCASVCVVPDIELNSSPWCWSIAD